MKLIKECPLCGQTYEIIVDDSKIRDYATGNGMIQDVFPELNPMEREFIKTGYCPNCQTILFGTNYVSDLIKEVSNA